MWTVQTKGRSKELVNKIILQIFEENVNVVIKTVLSASNHEINVLNARHLDS